VFRMLRRPFSPLNRPDPNLQGERSMSIGRYHPGTTPVRSCCGAGRTITGCYRGFDIHCSPCRAEMAPEVTQNRTLDVLTAVSPSQLRPPCTSLLPKSHCHWAAAHPLPGPDFRDRGWNLQCLVASAGKRLQTNRQRCLLPMVIPRTRNPPNVRASGF
jgi:hypothetical protein